MNNKKAKEYHIPDEFLNIMSQTKSIDDQTIQKHAAFWFGRFFYV